MDGVVDALVCPLANWFVGGLPCWLLGSLCGSVGWMADGLMVFRARFLTTKAIDFEASGVTFPGCQLGNVTNVCLGSLPFPT